MKRFAVVAALLLAGCSGGTEQDSWQRLEAFAAENRVGAGADYFLVKDSVIGTEAVALIYGMADDYGMCLELAELYVQRYPGDSYTCRRAN